jgi:hypothetical protein
MVSRLGSLSARVADFILSPASPPPSPPSPASAPGGLGSGDGRKRGVGLARVAFAAAWILGQAALVLSAGARPDHIFGFRMFPEASTVEIHLSRDTAAGTVAAVRGDWSARDAAGQLRHFSWRDRVRDPVLASIDAPAFASYGVDAQLARLGHALDDVADHIGDDTETLRLRADVVVRKNGAGPVTVRFASHPRSVRP